MSEKIQTPFIVTRDNEIDTELSVLPPTAVEVAVVRVQTVFSRITDNIALQARMAAFDTLHGTNYRRIRRELIEQQRREAFERSIGLVAIKH